MLYEHQKRIISDDPKKCGLFLGTGSGKTRIALMLSSLQKGSVLVICPKTQKEDGNWEREHNEIIANKYGMNTNNLTTISKETFKRDHASLPKFDTVIIDEAHTALGVTPNIRWRNKQPIPKASQLFEAIETYLKRTGPERLYLVTATPIRTPMTVYAAARLLGKNVDFYQWRNNFYTKLPMPGREVFVPRSDTATKEKLATLVKQLGYVGQLSDYFDVPPQTFITKYVELSAKQKLRIKQLSLEYPDPIVLIGKRHQVENGVLSGDEYNAPEYFENEKLDEIETLALQFPKMLIFARYIAQIEQIATFLRSKGYNVVTLTGNTKDRASVISEAEKSANCILIAQCQISSGWEVPSIPVVVYASMDYSVVNRVQSEGRVLRANHLKKNLYIDLVTKGGVDEAVQKSIKNKKDFNEKLYVN